MNHTIIHDRAGLNQFYAKVYAFVGLGIGLSALVSISVGLLFDAGTSLVDHCYFCGVGLGFRCQ